MPNKFMAIAQVDDEIQQEQVIKTEYISKADDAEYNHYPDVQSKTSDQNPLDGYISSKSDNSDRNGWTLRGTKKRVEIKKKVALRKLKNIS